MLGGDGNRIELDTTQGGSSLQPSWQDTQYLHETRGPCPHSHPSLICWRLTLYPLLLALGVTPPVRIESSSSHVAEGQSLDLNCLVAGQAHPQISWHKRGGSLPARHQVGGGKQRKNPKSPRRWGSKARTQAVNPRELQLKGTLPLACWVTLGQLLYFCNP